MKTVLLGDGGQREIEGAPVTRYAVTFEPNLSTKLANDTLHDGQSQPVAVALLLAELREWLKKVVLSLGFETTAVVTNPEANHAVRL